MEISYYVRDGHGSTRALTDTNGNTADTYDYDAFGNLIHSSTTLSSPAPNEFLFAGEQYDTETGHYYNRARYLNTSTGRFLTVDTYEGDPQSPLALHKYLYTAADPVDKVDPNGNQFEIDVAIASSIQSTLAGIQGNVGLAVLEQFQHGGNSGLIALALNSAVSTFFIGAAIVGDLAEKLPLRFTQETASFYFSDDIDALFKGETIASLAQKLRENEIAPPGVPVRYIVRNGVRLIVDTRSSLALLRANIPESQWLLQDVSGNPDVEVDITRRLIDNGLPNEGTEYVRITGFGQAASKIGE